MSTEDKAFYAVIAALGLLFSAIEVAAWLFGGWGR